MASKEVADEKYWDCFRKKKEGGCQLEFEYECSWDGCAVEGVDETNCPAGMKLASNSNDNYLRCEATSACRCKNTHVCEGDGVQCEPCDIDDCLSVTFHGSQTDPGWADWPKVRIDNVEMIVDPTNGRYTVTWTAADNYPFQGNTIFNLNLLRNDLCGIPTQLSKTDGTDGEKMVYEYTDYNAELESWEEGDEIRSRAGCDPEFSSGLVNKDTDTRQRIQVQDELALVSTSACP
eukprot:CAMPEP_0178542042 /NCGR_PEP_ID=MMETSP0697-20121206/1851_1 /TAXON_ID=265572 /ORGANISM="Extubocellulus spinifer, Strain CCMP396" /LENGTH=233 /DNA_ID=CAMNT_0020174423 /DNA_START=403 /DNA_END=1104 /DNA_ORIENTATION=-